MKSKFLSILGLLLIAASLSSFVSQDTAPTNDYQVTLSANVSEAGSAVCVGNWCCTDTYCCQINCDFSCCFRIANERTLVNFGLTQSSNTKVPYISRE